MLKVVLVAAGKVNADTAAGRERWAAEITSDTTKLYCRDRLQLCVIIVIDVL